MESDGQQPVLYGKNIYTGTGGWGYTKFIESTVFYTLNGYLYFAATTVLEQNCGERMEQMQERPW